MTSGPEPGPTTAPDSTTEPESTTERGPGPASGSETTGAPIADAGDDYGYDLAHEVEDALTIPVRRQRRPERRPSPAPDTGRPPEQDGDLGYDDAHEIRGS